ncbi:hypothetical protein [Nonomuraea endophytica]|uniref:hypothetical protein n=1 Tax=Nonomuraea endophytica TaxID=714136 RepID=UPI0037C59D58
MGLFGSGKDRSDFWSEQAAREVKTARQEARQANARRQRLASDTSTDRHADAYMARQHDENRRVAEANARDFQKMAKPARKRWF